MIEEEELAGDLAFDLGGEIDTSCVDRIGITLAKRIGPVEEASAAVLGLECLEQGKVVQPSCILASERAKSIVTGEAIRCFGHKRCLPGLGALEVDRSRRSLDWRNPVDETVGE